MYIPSGTVLTHNNIKTPKHIFTGLDIPHAVTTTSEEPFKTISSLLWCFFFIFSLYAHVFCNFLSFPKYFSNGGNSVVWTGTEHAVSEPCSLKCVKTDGNVEECRD